MTGEIPTPEAVSGFVDEVTEAARGGQLARWEGAICPHVIGLSEPHNAYIARTIDAVAEAVGARSGSPDCAVNLLVALVPDPARS